MTEQPPSLLERLQGCDLLEAAQLEELARLPEAKLPDPRALARQIVQRRWLTLFQINQVAAGRGKELRIGKYVLQERLGEGGMGQVFKAKQQHINRVVALKVIRKEKLTSELLVGRFYQEIQAAGQLRHPNIVLALDASDEAGTYYFAMEYVEGEDLARLVHEKGPLPVATACEYIRQAALGLHHAHEKGMVHRDIKPQNLLVDKQGIVKILDMGLARLGDNFTKDRDLTKPGQMIGTPDYLAPEQALDAHNVDSRADLYSLGCSLYFLLMGHPPYQGKAFAEVLLKHQTEEPPLLRSRRPEVPPDVDAIVRKLMAKKPAGRFATAGKAAEVLQAYLRGQDVTASIAAPTLPTLPKKPAEAVNPFADLNADNGDSARTHRVDPPGDKEQGNKPARYRVAGIGAGVALVLLAIGGVLAARSGKKNDPPPGRVADREAEDKETPQSKTPTPPESDDFEKRFRQFAKKHCVECHGPKVRKQKLRLDTLALTFDDKTGATWRKVHDRLQRGDMPPKRKARPDAKEARAVLDGLRQGLHQASLARQKREGRVVIRRLNRTEYETTLRDLLGIPVEVKSLLPEDNITAGFDKVSTALDISATHLLRYQKAAEQAVRSVIPSRPQTSIKIRRTGKHIAENTRHFDMILGKSARLQKDTLILHTRPYAHITCGTAQVPVAGRYRVRASVHAVGSGVKAVPMMMVWRDLYGSENVARTDVRDVRGGKAKVIEGTFELKARQVVAINGWSLPSEREFHAAMKGKKPDDKTPGLAVEWIEIEGPLGDWPPAGYKSLFDKVALVPRSVAKARAEGRPDPPQPAKRSDGWWIYDPPEPAPAKPRDDARRLMKSFLPRAFRRPVSDDLVTYYVKIVHAALDKKLTFAEAMIRAYTAALCSPHFLFLVETIDKKRGTALDDHAIASRLSYFLWSSMPDKTLFDLAAKGQLSKPAIRRAQVERMLKDPKAKRLTANFAGQWLDLRQINATSPDPRIYAEFDDFLFWSMPRETERFFEEILTEDRSLLEFVHSDWTFLNQRLAKHYGIKDIHGGELRKVKLPAGSRRGGVLTHASVLKVTADGTRTSPVLRGKWVLERILGQPPQPPPPDLPTIEPDSRGATTIRQQLDKHRNTPACATCHVHIDPPGFALENFDAIGGWRDFYRATGRTRAGWVKLPNYPERSVMRGPDVEKGGKTHDGKAFKDIDEYKKLLLADKDQLARNLVEKLIVYSTGADIQFADRAEVERLVAVCRQKKYGFRSLIHEVVGSRLFLNK